MSLSTRCPNCGTAFRVQPAQLAACAGKVRCGKCSTVFDGVAGLGEGDPHAQQAEPSPQLALFETARRTPALAATSRAMSDATTLPAFLEAAPPIPPGRNFAWGLIALVASIALAVQAALYFRTEIAVLFPESKLHLAAACEMLGCELRLPRRPDLMAIETSDLQTDAQRENVIMLNAVIRNRAPFAQEYPALELTLTDERDQAVARRVLGPADYLPRTPERLAEGVAAGADAAVRVHFDTSRVRAVGYRLYLFYP